MPSNYSNYTSCYIISLDSATLIESEIYFGTNRNIENEPSGFNNSYYWHYWIDRENSALNLETKSWDGFQIKIRKDQIKIKQGFPVWDMMSGTFLAARFMNFKGPGFFYFAVPEIVKEPIPVMYKIMGQETLKTPAGEFKTTKLSLKSADPFLGKLLEPYSKEMFFLDGRFGPPSSY